LPGWVRERLTRMPEALVHAERRTLGDPAGLELLSPGHTRRLARTPLNSLHGEVPLLAGLGPIRAALATLAKDPGLLGLELERACFLDIETTGLHGGAGNYPFLVAVGRVQGAELIVEQHFLSHPAGEAALLAAVAEQIAAGELLVSFFGKSFDRHRLEDKMRLHSIPAPFAGRPHLDLYHPLRRLYGNCFPNCRLSTLEQGLLGLERHNDLSGAFAPAAWFDHQAGRPHLLEGVFEHNRLDVLSLLALCAHLNPADQAPEVQRGQHSDSALSRAPHPGEPLTALQPFQPASSRTSALALARARAWAKLFRGNRDRIQELAWLDHLLQPEQPLSAEERRSLAIARAEALLALNRTAEARQQLEAIWQPPRLLRDSSDLAVVLLLLSPALARSRADVEGLVSLAAAFIQRYCHPRLAARHQQVLTRAARRWKLDSTSA
jgi:hypothetical protein